MVPWLRNAELPQYCSVVHCWHNMLLYLVRNSVPAMRFLPTLLTLLCFVVPLLLGFGFRNLNSCHSPSINNLIVFNSGVCVVKSDQTYVFPGVVQLRTERGDCFLNLFGFPEA